MSFQMDGVQARVHVVSHLFVSVYFLWDNNNKLTDLSVIKESKFTFCEKD